MGWTVHAAHMREKRNLYVILIRNTEEKKLHGRPQHRWEENVTWDLKK
jgi:hypothetical protein